MIVDSWLPEQWEDKMKQQQEEEEEEEEEETKIICKFELGRKRRKRYD